MTSLDQIQQLQKSHSSMGMPQSDQLGESIANEIESGSAQPESYQDALKDLYKKPEEPSQEQQQAMHEQMQREQMMQQQAMMEHQQMLQQQQQQQQYPQAYQEMTQIPQSSLYGEASGDDMLKKVLTGVKFAVIALVAALLMNSKMVMDMIKETLPSFVYEVSEGVVEHTFKSSLLRNIMTGVFVFLSTFI